MHAGGCFGVSRAAARFLEQEFQCRDPRLEGQAIGQLDRRPRGQSRVEAGEGGTQPDTLSLEERHPGARALGFGESHPRTGGGIAGDHREFRLGHRDHGRRTFTIGRTFPPPRQRLPEVELPHRTVVSRRTAVQAGSHRLDLRIVKAPRRARPGLRGVDPTARRLERGRPRYR